jgi:hypothetical protein
MINDVIRRKTARTTAFGHITADVMKRLKFMSQSNRISKEASIYQLLWLNGWNISAQS